MKKFKNQIELFEWIWENRPHVSEISGKPLLPKGNMFWHHQFLHVLSKGAYPSMKLDPNNIMLATKEEHEKQEQFDLFRQRKEELKQKYYQNKQLNKWK